MAETRNEDGTMFTPESHSSLQGEGGTGALKGDKTLADLAKQFDVHPDQITEWKSRLEAIWAFTTPNARTPAWERRRPIG